MNGAESATERVGVSFSTPIYKRSLFISNPWANIPTPIYTQRFADKWRWLISLWEKETDPTSILHAVVPLTPKKKRNKKIKNSDFKKKSTSHDSSHFHENRGR